MDSKYLADMKASVESFGTYSEVSYETWSDYLSVLSAINVYNKCGYLSDEEASEIASIASNMRLNLLREWEASHEWDKRDADQPKRNIIILYTL